MRDSTRIDAGQRKKTDVKLCREKMQNCEVVGEVHRQKLVKSTWSRWTIMGDDKKGDWCIVSLDGAIIRVKIMHKSRGKYKIIDDTKNGMYIEKIVDASDIIQVEKNSQEK